MRPSGGGPDQEPASSEQCEPGAVIGGKYRLVRRLDEGGMGTVWVAHNADLDVHVALKLIRAESNAESSAERLLNEARILARLDHPAIVRVNDFGRTAAGNPFIVMELLSGECLADMAYRQGRFTAASAVQLLLPIADALAVAHERGVVHRDLKPDNIFLAQLGSSRVQPKVLDFGIARTSLDGGNRLTQDGTVLGSPAYMSPEQARGRRDLDARTDIWSFCVLLYELLVGEVPFEGDNYNAVLRAIIETDPVPITDAAAGDAALWQILARGLHKDREQRWSCMRELGAALATWLLSHGVNEDVTRASLSSMWFESRGPDSDPFSVPPVALPRSSSAPPVPGRRPVETVDSNSLPALAMLKTSAPSIRMSTGGHGAVSFTAGSRRAGSGRRLVLAGLGVLLLGGGVLIGFRAVSKSALPRGAQAATSVRSAPPPKSGTAQAPLLVPAPRVVQARDAGVAHEAGATEPVEPQATTTLPQHSAAPAHAIKRQAHAASPPRRKAAKVGDLKVPY